MLSFAQRDDESLFTYSYVVLQSYSVAHHMYNDVSLKGECVEPHLSGEFIYVVAF